MEQQEEQYDIFHLGEVLEHLLNPKEIIETLRQLAPGGFLFAESPIEHNFHLSYITIAGCFKLRKRAQPQRVAAIRPFHVLFADAKNQQAFFERSGLRTLHFRIFEWAWPLPGKWEKTKTLKQKIEFCIAKLAVAAAGVVKGRGSRFYYIGTK